MNRFNGTPLLVLALGHWLVYLQLIKMFLPKTVEDDWFLYLLALTQVVVGAFLPGEHVGIVLMAWALAALWTLSLFYLHREAVPTAQAGGTATRDAGTRPEEPYPGLIDGAFVLSGLKVALLTLALGGLIFLLMPRWGSPRPPQSRSPRLAQNLTGFSETVELGRMGEILESEDIVMTIELYDETRQRVAPLRGRPVAGRGHADVLQRTLVPPGPRSDRFRDRRPGVLATRPLFQAGDQARIDGQWRALFAMRPILPHLGHRPGVQPEQRCALRGDIRLPGVLA